MPGATEKETDETWESLYTYNELFNMEIILKNEDYPNTRIYAALKRLPGSTLAWSFLANNNCSFKAQQAYDSLVSWASKILRWGTVRHEVGHALGLIHTPNDPESVMYPQMRGQWELNETDIQQMLGLGYRRRRAPEVPPPIPTPKIKVSSVVTVDGKEYELFPENNNGVNPWWPTLERV